MAKKKQTGQIETEHTEKLRGRESGTDEPGGAALWLAGILVLGVVFGDIGTSPLYALQKCLSGKDSVSPGQENILGLLSLIFWSIVIIVAVKYIIYVMRASNENEGGILALMALIEPAHPKDRSRRKWLIFFGIFGAALLYGDGMITPAISVLSAVEGLKVVNPQLENLVIPITVVILVLLFVFQRQGTSRVGWIFGPVMLIWFMTLLVSGIAGIVHNPEILKAINPVYAIKFFLSTGFSGFMVLGSVFLVVTGGEALYADIGHFGKRPIRLIWFILIMPALVANYFGQGALLLNDSKLAGSQLFYYLGPDWSLYPLIILATMATIIASQAIISASFSLTRQAVLLGYLPQLKMIQTSAAKQGQIYISGVNWIMMTATIGLVLGFRKSVNMAGAYGVAVSTTMVITTILMSIAAREKWNWPWWVVVMVTAFFLSVDIIFMGSNMFKIIQGGYFPLLVAVVVFMLMTAWRAGNARMTPVEGKKKRLVKTFMETVRRSSPQRVSGTAVFLTDNTEQVPLSLVRQLDFFRVLNEKVILLIPEIMDEPRISSHKRVEVIDLGKGVIQLIVHFGFMENPNIPSILKNTDALGKKVNPDKVIYYIEYPKIVFGGKWGLKKFIARVYSYMARNSANPVELFKIPIDKVLEVAVRVHLQ